MKISYKKLIQQFAKEKGCKFISIRILKFQKETLKSLSSTGFNNYKIELEKELI